MIEAYRSGAGTQQVQRIARFGGFFYLIIIVIGVLGEALIRNRLVVAGDPSATALRILESEFL